MGFLEVFLTFARKYPCLFLDRLDENMDIGSGGAEKPQETPLPHRATEREINNAGRAVGMYPVEWSV